MKIGQQEMFRPNTEDPNKKKQPVNPLRPITKEVMNNFILYEKLDFFKKGT